MKNPRRHKCTARISGILVAILLASSAFQSAFAADGTWTGAIDNTWQTSGNWDPAAFPGDTSGFSSTDIATFGAAGSGTLDLGGMLNIHSIRIGVNGGSAGALTIGDAGDILNLTSGGNITVGAGVTANEVIGTAGGSINLSTAANSTYSINNYGMGTLTIAALVTSSQTTGNVSMLTLGGSGNGSVTGVLSGTDTAGDAGLGLVKNGSGTWTLSGANTFTGATSINGGRLILDYATSDPLSTSAVTLNGGALILKGKSVGTTTEAISSLTLGTTAGNVNALTLDANGGSGVSLTIGTLNTGNNSAIVNLIDLSSSSSNSITINALGSSPAVVNGVLMSGSSGNRSAITVVQDSTGYGFATLSGSSSGTLGRLTTGTELTASNSTNTNTNVRLTAAGTVTRTANLNYNTLTIDSAAGDITLEMGAFNFATAQGRSILVSGANDVTISGTGNLGSVALFNNYSTGTLSISLAGSTSSMLFAGTGFTDYSGIINGGSITMTVGGGIVRFSANRALQSLNTKYIVSGGGVLEIGADLNETATTGDFSSAIGTANGNIRFLGDSGLSAAGVDRVVNFGGAVTPTTITWGSAYFLTDVDGATDGGYTLKLSSARSDAKLTIRNGIALGTNTNRVIDVANGSAATDSTLSGVLSGSGATLTKNGAGTLELAAANTYSGGTIVGTGTLLINNTTGSGVGSGNVTVHNGAAVGGTGSFTGELIVNAGGTLRPGASIETLGSGAITLEDGSAFDFELDSSVSVSVGADLQKVSGNLTLEGTVTLTLSDIANTPEAFTLGTTFTLINYTGTWNDGLLTYDGNAIANGETFTAGLNTWQLDYDAITGGSNFSTEYLGGSYVNIVAVPEPSTAMLILFGLGMLAVLRFQRVSNRR